ncbi:hypothetical protein [Parasphingorhabdus sp.]|uniref:hypothetical protein n=1 Tax=Parasphingorhabdus sp. TaxID=2709688 RepID=UPI003003635D
MLRRLTGMFLLIAAVPTGILFLQRRGLPYNELGRYFDPAEGLVYEAQAVTIYGALATIFLCAGLAVLLGGKRPNG